jgi:hypothetical protein
MKYLIISFTIHFVSVLTLANTGLVDPVYYIGQQAGESCYVEARYSEDGLKADLRVLIIDEHGGSNEGFDTIETLYSNLDKSYIYTSSSPQDEVLSLELKSNLLKNGESLTLVLNHGEHPHPVFCENLVIPSGADLISVQNDFNNFDQFLVEHEEVAGNDEDDHNDSHDEEHDH